MRTILKIVLLLAMLLPGADLFAKGEKQLTMPYQIEGTGKTASQGSYLVNVTVTSKKNKIDDAEVAKCAVHGVLFRGFSAKGSLSAQKPLARSAAAEAEHADFFEPFFKEGTATRYASTVPGSRTVVKIGKQYQISETVEVRKDQLRSDLQEAGVLKGLSSGF